jgi:hypothetical protein
METKTGGTGTGRRRLRSTAREAEAGGRGFSWRAPRRTLQKAGGGAHTSAPSCAARLGNCLLLLVELELPHAPDETRRKSSKLLEGHGIHARHLPPCHAMPWSRAGRAVLLMRAVNTATPCKVKLLTAPLVEHTGQGRTGPTRHPAPNRFAGLLAGQISHLIYPARASSPSLFLNPCPCSTAAQRISSRFSHHLPFVYSTSSSVSERITHLSPPDALFPPHLTLGDR